MIHSRIVHALCVAALAAALGAQAQSTIYRWVDKNGKVHFSDSPPADTSNVTQQRMGGGYVDDSQLPYATQQAMKKSPVTLFVSNDCGELCAQGRELLNRRGIPFSERNAQANAGDAEALRKLIGELQVPVLLVGESSLKGYSEETWQSALDGAGYPRTRLPRPATAPQR